MKRRLTASMFALLSAATVALLAMPGCSGSNTGSGFGGGPDKPGNNNNNNNGDDAGDTTYPDATTVGNLGPAKDGGTGVTGDAGCATASAQASRQPVYMLFVLDGSGSMQQNNKWVAATAALKNIFQDFQTKADNGFGVGLIVFSDTLDKTHSNGPYPGAGDVPIGFVDANQLSKLNTRLGGSWGGDTPTYTALTGGYGELESFTGAAPLQTGGKKVLVILTDGVPTDACDPNFGNPSTCFNAASGELTKAPPAGPVTTFVIGTGQFPSPDTANFDPSFLGQLAKAGGAAPSGCNPTETSNLANLCYFEVDPTTSNAQQLTQKFEDAINTIRGQIASCTFALKGTGTGTIDPTKVNVNFTGSNGVTTTLNQDPQNGWSYDNPGHPTEVILNGTSCANMKNDPMAKITIVLGCATQVPK